MTPLDAALMVIAGLSLGGAQCVTSRGLTLMAPAGFASGMPMTGALSGVFTPPLWLLLGLTVGLALHVALLHLLANFPLASILHRRKRGRSGGPLTRRWPLEYCFCWPQSVLRRVPRWRARSCC